MECERRRQGKLGAPSPAPVRGGPRAPRSWLRLCPSGLRDARRARPLRLLRRCVAVTPSTRHLVAGGGCRACVSPRPLWAAPRGLPVLSRLSVEVRRAPRVLTEGRYLPRAAQEPERPDASPARPPSAPGIPPASALWKRGPHRLGLFLAFPPGACGDPTAEHRASCEQGTVAHPFARGGRFGAPRGGRSVPRHRGCACVCISRHAVRVRCGSPPGSCPFVLRWPRRPRAPPSALPATATRLPRASPRGRNTPSISSRAARSGGARVLVLGSLKNSGRLFLLIRSSYLCGRRASPSLSALGLWVAASLS